MGTLTVLMLKHLVVRLRRFIHTTIELVSPIVFFLLLFVCKGWLQDPIPTSHSVDLDNIHLTDEVAIKKINFYGSVGYFPKTKLTDKLMDEVAYKLDLARINTLPGPLSKKQYYSLPNISYLQQNAKNMNEEDAVVIFNNIEEGTENMPTSLNYTIRMKFKFFTNDYEVAAADISHHENFGRDYEPFMKIQWAIDSSYLRNLTGNDVTQEVYLQEFPFASPPQSKWLTLVVPYLEEASHMGLLLLFIFLGSRLLEERTSGIKELIRMVGVSPFMLNLSHFLNAVPTVLVFSIVGAVLMKATSQPLLPNSNILLIMVALALYAVTIVALAFVCSYVLNSNQFSVSVLLLVYLLFLVPATQLPTRSLPAVVTILTGLLPHVPLAWFYQELMSTELHNSGVKWSTMTSSHSICGMSVLASYVMMLAQCVLLYMVMLYLSCVRPGPYGVARPFNFFCTMEYWGKQKVDPEFKHEGDLIVGEQDKQYFEELPSNAEVGINIINVTKVFNKQAALSHVSLQVLQGEITVLLGHNGAGKTTLMSIITGMTSATEGKVLVNGLDVVTQRKLVGKQLGLCPQHNIFFPDLTVLQHVLFFSMLKGLSYYEAMKASNELLTKLDIRSKASCLSSQLSGGMKRRLQLACALAGGAKLLILDEPTSGLDVETRRELWNLLLSVRGSRTILLTTHFMEEADALGDRVAALHAGVLRSHATTMHLKKNIGKGYRLSLTTIGLPRESAITSVVTSHIPDATLKEKSLNSITFCLPTLASKKFPQLFSALENKRSELSVDAIGVGVSTLEEVFLKLCSDVTTTFEDDSIDGANGYFQEPTFNRVSGCLLVLHQLWVLMTRQIKYIISKKWTFLFMLVILPMATILSMSKILRPNPIRVKDNPPAAMNLGLYGGTRLVMLSGWDQGVLEKYPNVVVERTEDAHQKLILIGKADLMEYKKYTVGIELNDTIAKVMFTTTVRHAAPVALNLLSNLLASRAGLNVTISTYNYPIDLESVLKVDVKMPVSGVDAAMWNIFIALVITSTLMNAATLPSLERMSGARHIHIMSGCGDVTYWTATLLVHVCVYSLVLVAPTLAAAAQAAQTDMYARSYYIGTMVLLLELGILSTLAVCYLVSFYCGERSAGLLLAVLFLPFGILPGSVDGFNASGMGFVWRTLIFLTRWLIPAHDITSGCIRANAVATESAYCRLNLDLCPNIPPLSIDFDTAACCTKRDSGCYLCWNDKGPINEIIILAVQFIVYMSLVILHQNGIFNGLYDRVTNIRYKPEPTQKADKMVEDERHYVAKANKMPQKQIPDAMLICDVHKRYNGIIKRCQAVKGVSISVKKGECFGILGVNGAGKSTTFKMITAEVAASRGTVFANGHRLNWQHRSKYLQSLGYCPQFFGLDEFLTGRENLTLILTMRGLAPYHVKQEVEAWTEVVGLERYIDQPVSSYSGGCKRRMSCAASLCSGAPVSLLDEPTTGVDVAARRRVWSAIKRALNSGRSVIITSHSMDEMEALCDRIAIMSGGVVRALGSPAALRTQHAPGHSLSVKLRGGQTDETDSSQRHSTVETSTELSNLKEKFYQKLNCTLKDEHKTMLRFHINESMRYSDLFAILEELQTEFPNIEDYSVTETTLEEVFLSFARENEAATV